MGAMLEIVQFDDGEYGIRNTWSGQILSEKGELLSYKNQKHAERKAKRLAKRFNKTIERLNKQTR